jgi:hypothetical protein
MSTQGTVRLKVANEAPSIEKLWNNRYRLSFFCTNNSPKEDWYYENISSILPEYGILQEANFGSGVNEDWEAIPGSVYPNMRLIESGYPYNVRSGKHYVQLTYETLTNSWVEEKQEDVNYGKNGLKEVSRTLVALPNTVYTNVIGTTTIVSDGKTLYLNNYQLLKTDAKWSLKEIWVEAGVLSVSSSKDSITGQIVVNAIKLTAEEVRNKVNEITGNHNLKSNQINDFNGLNSFQYVFEIRSTNIETELGDPQIGVEFETGIQTDGSSDFIITRKYAISSANTVSSIKELLPPEITDPVFDGTGGTQKAYIVDQEVKPNGLDGAELTRTFAMLPSSLEEWDEMVVRFPGVDRGPFQLDEGFDFRSEPYSEAVPIRVCRDFYLSNPQRICRPKEFRPVDSNGNRVTVLTANTVPTADEYIGYVNSGKYLNERVHILRWQGDIWERRVVQFKAE